eukprot:1137829-Pelagomonas_calceolata.AAC.1
MSTPQTHKQTSWGLNVVSFGLQVLTSLDQSPVTQQIPTPEQRPLTPLPHLPTTPGATGDQLPTGGMHLRHRWQMSRDAQPRAH